MRKTRPDDKLAALNVEQQGQLWELLKTPGISYAQARDLVRTKFGVETSTRALSMWWRKKAKEEADERMLRSKLLADDLGEKFGEKLPAITKALKVQLTQTAFEIGMSGGDPKVIERLMNIVGGINEAELTKAKIQLELDKFRESLKSQQDKALDALFAEIRGNKAAEQLFFKFRDAVRGAIKEAA